MGVLALVAGFGARPAAALPTALPLTRLSSPVLGHAGDFWRDRWQGYQKDREQDNHRWDRDDRSRDRDDHRDNRDRDRNHDRDDRDDHRSDKDDRSHDRDSRR